jgi:hypothetical protein
MLRFAILAVPLLSWGCTTPIDPAVKARVDASARAACVVQARDGALLVRLVAVGSSVAAPEAAPLATLGAGASKVMLDAACDRLAERLKPTPAVKP